MTEPWTSATLSDLAEVNPDKASAVRGLERFRYIDISRLSQRGVSEASSIPLIEATEAPSRAQRLVKAGDSLVSTVRPERGARGLVGSELDGQVASSGICVLRPKLASDAGFVYALVRDPAFTEWLVNHSTGTTYPAVAPADIARFPFRAPSLGQRRRIAEVLGALDAAIEVSESLIATLGDAIDAEAASVLQDAGGETRLLTSVVTVTNGYSYKSSELVEESDTAMVNLKNFGRHGGFRLEGLKPFSGSPKPTHVLEAGDVMIAKTDLTQDAEVIGRCLRMPRLPQFTHYVASLDIAILRSKGEIPQATLAAILSQPDFRDHCLGFANGTTVLHMSKAALETYTIPVLSPEAINGLTARVEVMAEQQDRRFAELHHAQKMRDFLLPRLVSGELRVAEAEELAEAAT